MNGSNSKSVTIARKNVPERETKASRRTHSIALLVGKAQVFNAEGELLESLRNYSKVSFAHLASHVP